MSGEHDLHMLLAAIRPKLQPEKYVFCTVESEYTLPQGLSPRCIFREAEGTTVIVTKQDAERLSLSYQYVSRMITLNVHSSLEAVGFLAAVTSKLAEHGISVNPVSAYYHDHLFVAS
ncbi:ribonuclease H [candidate division KSB3 bacterium]|uniref:Ribonuclease H n=1 Tax=candidate division KSB3 bacterium TaxID=2044937 RepID=A0A2G6KDB0_9BACT|nr:MAG: ribonuclease H [candidate division KSB3 bacterium]